MDHRFAADIAEIIAEDTDHSREEALLLGHGLAGLVQSASRHWAAQAGQDGRPDLDGAADFAFRLAWRGISRFPSATGWRRVTPPAENRRVRPSGARFRLFWRRKTRPAVSLAGP